MCVCAGGRGGGDKGCNAELQGYCVSLSACVYLATDRSIHPAIINSFINRPLFAHRALSSA